MKKYVIYLLSLLMVFSPAAVFADVEAPADPGDAVEAEIELNDDAENAAVAQEQAEEVTEAVQEEAQETAPEEADLAPAEQEVVKAEAAAAGSADHWEGNKYLNGDGVPYTGLFKATKRNGETGNGLYYAEADGTVNPETRIVTVSTGDKYKYVVTTDGVWDKIKEDDPLINEPLSYLVLNDTENNDCSIVANKNIWGTDKKYFVGDYGLARTEAGLLNYDGKTYFVNPGGQIQTTESIVYDPSVDKWRYVDATGEVKLDESTFIFAGATWYRDAYGYVNKTPSIFVTYKGTTKYYTNPDGSLYTIANQIITTADGKRYITGNGGAIRTTPGVVDFAGSKYVALADGSICTTPGFVNAGGARYYVLDSSGALAVNKSFKSGSKTYHALADGTIGVGVHKWGKSYYYGDANGAIRTKKGVVSWAGNKYYVNKGGKISTNKKVKYKGKTYIAGSNGAFFKGIFTWKNNLYYASTKGVLRTKAGAFSYNGKRYYSRKGGKLYRNKFFTAKGKKYLAQNDGSLKAGAFAWKGKQYLTNANCAVITKAGIYTYGSHQYYVKKGGPLAVNEFVTYKGNHYYAGGDGAIVKKKFTYQGITITPDPQTGVISLEEYWKVFPNEAPQAAGN